MPGWHKIAQQYVKSGQLKMIGVIQEQHAERCELFAQWQKFDWPIVHDPINLLGNSAVPLTIAIDEHGIVRSRRPSPRTFKKEFIDAQFKPLSGSPNQPRSVGVSTDWGSLLQRAESSPTVDSLKAAADSLILWGKADKISQAIELYESALSKSRTSTTQQDPTLLFRLGVAHQMRHDSGNRSQADLEKAVDFKTAVDYWSRALAANPNQYIWRRRIQQYGPRLDKPYPFYDWVKQARKDIVARGEKPIALPVEPVGAELAARARSLEASAKAANPDPENQIIADPDRLIKIEPVVVPHTSRASRSSMVHLLFTPRKDVQWSNEAGPLTIWVDNQQVVLSQKLFQVSNRKALESAEPRKVEFEVSRSTEIKSINGYALYYVCEKSGECRYLRQDFEVQFPVVGKNKK